MKNNHHSVPPLIEARARYGAGQLAYVQTDYEVAVELYRESLALYRSSNDKQGIALSLSGLGNVAEERCEYSHAQELHEKSLALYRELNDQRGIATELVYLVLQR